MKQSAKKLVDLIEIEIQLLLDEPKFESNNYNVEQEFEYGSFAYDLSINEVENKYLDEWDAPSFNVEIEVKSVTVTNESNKELTNLSKEVFNQLEENYTNY